MYALSVDIITTTIMSTITMTMKMDSAAVDTTTIMTTIMSMSTITMTMKTDIDAVDTTMIMITSITTTIMQMMYLPAWVWRPRTSTVKKN